MATPPETEPRLTIQYIDRMTQFYTEDRLQLFEEAIPLDMVYIPAGQFIMGSSKDELGHVFTESPQHLVTIASPFFMGKYPITQAQWRVVADLPKQKIGLNPNPSSFTGENRPVETISWDEAVEFCSRLATSTGRPYRPPSEAEWEYACRAGTTTPFHCGESIITDLANYRGMAGIVGGVTYTGSYGEGLPGQFRDETTDVDTFGVANAFGLSDMHGNVWEWCQDTWHDGYDMAPNDASTWVGENENNARCLRGGSWVNDPVNCRSAARGSYDPGDSSSNIGLRVVCGVART